MRSIYQVSERGKFFNYRKIQKESVEIERVGKRKVKKKEITKERKG